MKVAELIKRRQPAWLELERLSGRLGSKRLPSDQVHRFSSLYRSACADLALAESYQLPPNTVDYLHRLVARAHNQLYRSKKYRWKQWSDVIFRVTPRRIFHEPCVHIVTVVFWGLFMLSVAFASDDGLWPGFCESVVGDDQMQTMREMHGNAANVGASSNGDRSFSLNSAMFGYYVLNNAGIGLSCFVSMLGVLPGMVTLTFNSIFLGSVFGYMFRPEVGAASQNFQRFVTAHGPFELTAIVLSAGAGLKIGFSWIKTNGLGRKESLIKVSREALPIAMTGVILFCMAAVIEGFISPQQRIPWAAKGVIAIISNFLLLLYLVVLGFPEPDHSGESQQ